MNNFTFHSPTEFVLGRDTQKQTGKLVVKYGGGKEHLATSIFYKEFSCLFLSVASEDKFGV